MTVPALIRDAAIPTTLSHDTLAAILDGIAARGYMACVMRTDGVWRATLGQIGGRGDVFMATDDRLDVALIAALTKLPKVAARV